MVQLTKSMIGLAIICVISALFTIFLADGAEHYSPVGYDDTALVKMQDSFNATAEIVNKTYERMSDIDSNSGIFDIVGNFLSQSLAAVKISVEGLSVWRNFIDIGADALNLGEATKWIIVSGTLIVIILFLSILLHILTKSDRV